YFLPIVVFQGPLNKQVGQPGVFWQHWTMRIGAKNIFIHSPLNPIFAVIAPTGQDFPQWLGLWSQIGAPAMVLIAYQLLSACLWKRTFQGHVGHEAGISTFRIQVQHSNSLELWTLKGFVRVTKQLIPCTDAQEDGICLCCLTQRCRLELDIL